MVCESWKAKLDTYLDGELPEEEMSAFDAHVRACPTCAADALARVQMKRAIQVAGKQFTPSAEFRQRVQQSITPLPALRTSFRPAFRLGWIFAAAVAIIAAALISTYVQTRAGREQASRDHIYSEIADLHVATLASSSPVDVVSTDRHTVKPWFQGKIPFAFNLPELQNTGFSLVGGSMTYLGQAPGAHLIYDVRKHHISVFIFQERPSPSNALPMNPPVIAGENSVSPKNLPFNLETWSQAGLRFFVIGDASAADIDGLAKLFKAAS
jgi:anti-sigma factor RsiW